MAKKGRRMNINVCIPTLNSADEFWKCVDSIQNSSVKCNIYVVDNGGYVDKRYDNMFIYKPSSNVGVAGSWNYFLKNVPDIRIITNDDIVFDSAAIEKIVTLYGHPHLVSPENLSTPFSCFMISDKVASSVGYFDEWISPKYAYFEDDDYSRRMSILGIGIIKASGAYVEHLGSSTLKHFNREQERLHHEKFRLARAHYVKKWGGEPHSEKYTSPFGL